MKFIQIIRRIDMINRAFDRVPDDDRHEVLLDALREKRVVLVKELHRYIKGNDNIFTEPSLRRRRQVKLACRLLGIDYRAVIN